MEENDIQCKNCRHLITGYFTKEALRKNPDYKQGYKHFCYSNHSPTGCRQYSGHSNKGCCKCNCSNPELMELIKNERYYN